MNTLGDVGSHFLAPDGRNPPVNHSGATLCILHLAEIL